ncbi:unnamed protein product [Protopolystoma xenopodis]|uniref:Molybdopterin cofactor biosynthesis C (MoaC) domain-containing protein n=1 Tax=Protopolystoma xenopodis TaxID=117903 RepID=A0A3S5CHV3_9PLAT|nr:unnamed protein product [Protopolystoma xenopodis]
MLISIGSNHQREKCPIFKLPYNLTFDSFLLFRLHSAQIALSHISVDLVPVPRGLHITTIVRASAGQATGVEMEALTAASIAALTVYDMCKAVQPGTICIESLRLVKKCGGSSS